MIVSGADRMNYFPYVIKKSVRNIKAFAYYIDKKIKSKEGFK